MVKFVDEQSENDRLRAVNAELLEALKDIAKMRSRYESPAARIAIAVITKVANQEAVR